MKKRFLLLAVAVVAVPLCANTVATLAAGGLFRPLELRGAPDGVLSSAAFPGGTEDLVFRANGREIFVSSGDFRDASREGALLLVDAKLGATAEPTNVLPPLDFPFQPHGLDIWRGPDGSERLFVVNHRNGSGFTQTADVAEVKHTIEVFDVAPDGRLTHVRSVEGPLLNSPNDVAATGPDSFYATNDHAFEPGVGRTIEEYLRLPIGNVVYFDGTTFREVFSGTRYANGIAASDDGREVYLAETTGALLRIFDRDPATGELTETASLDHHTGLDNIDIAPDGSLWVGAHPKLLEFSLHAHDPRRHSPSHAIRYSRGENGFWRADTFWMGDGSRLSGSSVAATNGKVVVVGSVFQPRLLFFDLD